MDDVARAEEALVEAMARGLYEDWRAEWQGRNPERIAPPWEAIPRDYEGRSDFVRDARTSLAAAREVTVSVPCGMCGGRGGYYPVGDCEGPPPEWRPCPNCSNGTVSRSALAVLMGEADG